VHPVIHESALAFEQSPLDVGEPYRFVELRTPRGGCPVAGVV
jgi:hypothetical protein